MFWWSMKNKLNVSWFSGLLSAVIFISTCEWGVQMPPLTAENSHFLWSEPQEATLVMAQQGLPPMVGLCWLESPLHTGNRPEVQPGLCHLYVDCCHSDNAMVFQFHVCLFHGHDCHEFEDTWLCTTAGGRCERTEKDIDYLMTTYGYTLMTIWEREWDSLKCTDPSIAVVVGGWAGTITGGIPQSPMSDSRLSAPGSVCRCFCRLYMRTSSTSPSLISIHPWGWRTSTMTYWPFSSQLRCPRRMLDCTFPGSARALASYLSCRCPWSVVILAAWCWYPHLCCTGTYWMAQWSHACTFWCSTIGNSVSSPWPRTVLRSGGPPSRTHRRP